MEKVLSIAIVNARDNEDGGVNRVDQSSFLSFGGATSSHPKP